MSFVRHLFNVYRVKKKERKNETEREGREVNEKKGKNGWMGGKERPETRSILSQRDKCGCRALNYNVTAFLRGRMPESQFRFALLPANLTPPCPTTFFTFET